MHEMARLCWMTMLNPYLLFMIALRHMMHTWMSSVVSPIFNLVEWRISFDIRLPSRSRADDPPPEEPFVAFISSEEEFDLRIRGRCQFPVFGGTLFKFLCVK